MYPPFLLRPKHIVLGLIAAATLVACGGSSNPSTIPTVPTPPSSIPTQTPSTPPVVAQSVCERMGDGTYAAPCSKGAARFYDAVDGAIDKLIKKQPQLFDLNDIAGPGSYRVVEPDDYYLALGATLAESGFCAQMDPDKVNLRVKADNEISEDYQVLTTKGFTARGSWIYRNTCTPAAFPVAAPDAISYIRISFFGFNCAPGVSVPDRGTKELPLKCDGYLTATPKDANGRDVPSKIHGDEVRWFFKKGEEVVSLREWSEPFNLTVIPQSLGYFKICATVQGFTGCLAVEVLP